MRRGGSGGSRAPSRLSIQPQSPALGGEATSPGTTPKSRSSLPFRAPSGVLASQSRAISGARPLSRQPSKEAEIPVYEYSRRGSVQHQLPKSPAQPRAVQPASDSEEDMTRSKAATRRPNPMASGHRRVLSTRKETQRPPLQDNSEDSDDVSQSFLPFANTAELPVRSTQDPSATLRGGLPQAQAQTQTLAARPQAYRRTTSERVALATAPSQLASQQNLTYSTSSLSSGPSSVPRRTANHPSRPPATEQTHPGAPNPLSPRQQAALARAAGLSPRHRSRGNGSDTR